METILFSMVSPFGTWLTGVNEHGVKWMRMTDEAYHHMGQKLVEIKVHYVDDDTKEIIPDMYSTQYKWWNKNFNYPEFSEPIALKSEYPLGENEKSKSGLFWGLKK